MRVTEVKLYVDGSVKKASQADSRGRGAYKYMAVSQHGTLLHEQAFREDNQTVPETELKALIKGLAWFIESPYCQDALLHVFTDSELVFKWMTGAYRVRAENIIPFYLKAKGLKEKIEQKGIYVQIEKIRGKDNLAHLEA